MTETCKQQPRLSVGKIVFSLLLFTLWWAVVTDAWNISGLIFGPEKTEWQKFVYDIACRIVWVLPVVFLLRHYAAVLPVSPKTMFTGKINIKIFLLFFGFFTAYAVIGMFVNFGAFRINPNFSPLRHTVFYLVVGLVEELVYRGWALNAFSASMPGRRANIVATLFFILLHWPAYFIRFFLTGSLQFAVLLQQSLVILVMGLLFGYMFRKGKSIWVPILLHAYFDWIVDLLVS